MNGEGNSRMVFSFNSMQMVPCSDDKHVKRA